MYFSDFEKVVIGLNAILSNINMIFIKRFLMNPNVGWIVNFPRWTQIRLLFISFNLSICNAYGPQNFVELVKKCQLNLEIGPEFELWRCVVIFN